MNTKPKPITLVRADGSTYSFTPNPDNAKATITLPGGRIYAGDPTNFPLTITRKGDEGSTK